MKSNKLKSMKWNYIIESLIMVAIGAVLIIWPQGSLEIMAKALAVLLLLAGGVLVASYIIHRERSLVMSGGFALGIVVAALGVFIFANPLPFIDFIPRLFGVFIIASGLTNMAQTFSLMHMRYGLWWLSLIFALLTVILGGILLFNPKMAENLLVTIIGGFLAFDGVTNLWTASRVSKFSRSVKQAYRDANAIDVEAEVIDSDNNPER